MTSPNFSLTPYESMTALPDKETHRVRSLLLVDGHPESLASMGLSLNKIGLELLVARSGEEAIDLAKEHKPYLILLDTDIQNKIDSYAICRYLNADKMTRKIPVIFLSSENTPEIRAKCFKAGGIDFIQKSIHKRELRIRIKNHVRNRSKFRRMERKQHELKKEIIQLKKNIYHHGQLDIFKDIFDHAGLFISLLDAKGTFLQVNQYSNTLFGYSPKEMLALSSYEIGHPAYSKVTEEAIKFLNRGDNNYCEFEKKFIRKDKSEFWGLHSLHSICDENKKLLGIVCTVQDISAVKSEYMEMEAELTSARSLTAQLADDNVEQHFKTTEQQNNMDLDTMLNCLTNMLDTGISDQQKKTLENIRSISQILLA